MGRYEYGAEKAYKEIGKYGKPKGKKSRAEHFTRNCSAGYNCGNRNNGI